MLGGGHRRTHADDPEILTTSSIIISRSSSPLPLELGNLRPILGPRRLSRFQPANTPASLKSGTPPNYNAAKAFLIHRHVSRDPHADERVVVQGLAKYIGKRRTKEMSKLALAWSQCFLCDFGWCGDSVTSATSGGF